MDGYVWHGCNIITLAVLKRTKHIPNSLPTHVSQRSEAHRNYSETNHVPENTVKPLLLRNASFSVLHSLWGSEWTWLFEKPLINSTKISNEKYRTPTHRNSKQLLSTPGISATLSPFYDSPLCRAQLKDRSQVREAEKNMSFKDLAENLLKYLVTLV